MQQTELVETHEAARADALSLSEETGNLGIVDEPEDTEQSAQTSAKRVDGDEKQPEMESSTGQAGVSPESEGEAEGHEQESSRRPIQESNDAALTEQPATDEPSNVVTGGPLDEPALRGGGATARMPDSDATPKSVTAVADSAASESGTPKPTDAATGQSENAPQTAAARLGGARGQESPGSRVDAESLVNRVENAIRAARSNGGALRIRLNPPELGSLQIEVSTRGGMFTARLEVQTSAARQAILENIAQLKDALAQSGTPLDKIEVHLAENESEEGRFGKNGDREQAEHDLEHGDPDRPSNSQADVDLQESPDDSEQDAINRPRSPRGLQQQLPMDQLDIQV